MGCNKISNLCSESQLTTCIDHEAPLGVNTKITNQCVSQSMVNTDLYLITDEIIKNQSTENLGSLCLTYPLTDGEITLKSVNELHEQEICSLKTNVEDLQNLNYSELDITSFNLDFGCLVDPCGDPISKLGQLLQIIINKTCE